jgi:probable rRNA maturation factor
MSDNFIQEIAFISQSSDGQADRSDALEKFIKEKLVVFYKKEEFVLNFIFLSIEDIVEMNKQYLNHDYPTDVITFDFSEDFGVFGGDIFICPQIIKENANLYYTEYDQELLRVVFHGILHLIGFNDKTDEEKEEMNEQEELLLEMYRNY